MSAAHALHHAEHAAHAGHGPEKLGTYIGITMAILGVLLAMCSALVGSERTHLVQQLVEQQHAHAKYQAQDVKHRAAFLALTQVHATAFGSGSPTVNKESVLTLAHTVERYLDESVLAKEWTNAYGGIVKAHMDAQEEYEHGLLAAEIGIVIASIALLMHRKEAWFVSILLGLAALFIVVKTLNHTSHAVHEAHKKIAETEAKYEEARKAHKTTESEAKLVSSMITWAGGAATATVEHTTKTEAAAPAKKGH